MKRGKFNVVMDSAWGSSGKGKVASWLAKQYGVTDASSCNMPNAGHTVEDAGERTVYKVLPAASHYGAVAWMGPGTVIDRDRLHLEMGFGRTKDLYLHERAGILEPKHAAVERATLSGISSTMQGSAACASDKMCRSGTLAGGYPELGSLYGDVFRDAYHTAMQSGVMLHEVAQGWGLSLDHGTSYPYCTSRNCGLGRAMDDMAINPGQVGDVYLVVRTFPIRVGNTADGYSGDFLPDQTETSWAEIEANTGLQGLAAKELTTVTKRVRRVATFSRQLFKDAVRYNGVTKIIVTFPEYLDARAFKIRSIQDLPPRVLSFCKELDQICWDLYEDGSTGRLLAHVEAVSTGPDVNDMVGYR